MKYLTRLYAYSNKAPMRTFIRTYTTNYSSCYAKNCNYPQYMFSPIGAVIFGGCIFSVSIKAHIGQKLVYIERQNEEIIERLRCIEKEKETQNNIEK